MQLNDSGVAFLNRCRPFSIALAILLPPQIPFAQNLEFSESVLRVVNRPYSDVAEIARELQIELNIKRYEKSRAWTGEMEGRTSRWEVSGGEDLTPNGDVKLMVMSLTRAGTLISGPLEPTCTKVGDFTGMLRPPTWRRIVTGHPYREIFERALGSSVVSLDVSPPRSARMDECARFVQFSFKVQRDL